jgi:hypothetical protein
MLYGANDGRVEAGQPLVTKLSIPIYGHYPSCRLRG